MPSCNRCSEIPRECLRHYGKTIGRCPRLCGLFSFCSIVGLAIAGVVVRSKSGVPVFNEKSMEEMWTLQGGPQEYEIRTAMEKHHNAIPENEGAKAVIVLINGIDELEGKDIARPELFVDLFDLYSKWYTISVTTSFNTTWSIHDLCARGPMPDVPGAMVMPCFVIDPFNCFSDFTPLNHQSFQDFDNMMGENAPWPLAMYSHRPALADVTLTELHEILEKGCKWWLDFLVFQPEDWAGGLAWDNSTGPGQEKLISLETILFQFIYDTPKNAKSRLQLTTVADEIAAGNVDMMDNFKDDFKEGQELHIEAWMAEVKEFNLRSNTLKVNAMIFPDWYEEVARESASSSGLMQILGLVCMTMFIVCALGNFGSPLESRSAVALKGLALVVVSGLSSAGITLGYGLQFNNFTLIVLPNLALGLGVNDMFVLLRSFSELGNSFICSHDFSEVAGALFADAGVGVLLTSLCNFVSLVACSISLRIAIIQDSCLTIAIVVLVNFLCMTTIFPYFLYIEKCRVQQGHPEKLCCTYIYHARTLRRGLQERPSTSGNEAIKRFVACIANPEPAEDHRHWLQRLCLPECRPASLGRFTFKNGVLAVSVALVVHSLVSSKTKSLATNFLSWCQTTWWITRRVLLSWTLMENTLPTCTSTMWICQIARQK